MKPLCALIALPFFTVTALAAVPALAGDIAAGEADFKKCKACHSIEAADGTMIQKGGKTGPNLFGVIGRKAGSYDGFKFGPDLVAAGEGGLIWSEQTLAQFIEDPKAFLSGATGNAKAKSKMTYKHKKGAGDMAAYLASLGG